MIGSTVHQARPFAKGGGIHREDVAGARDLLQPRTPARRLRASAPHLVENLRERRLGWEFRQPNLIFDGRGDPDVVLKTTVGPVVIGARMIGRPPSGAWISRGGH